MFTGNTFQSSCLQISKVQTGSAPAEAAAAASDKVLEYVNFVRWNVPFGQLQLIKQFRIKTRIK